ncbi:MAG: AbrB/MazE/SpoVT family DNA-binding domain-containing protein [Candidatus Nanohaloarchaea archaeon]|nr:AbrB/MazE/SpoVT family DNA-binding domain-containing protein [Candidatus Nanohaloarchaea archaeon]
MPTMTSKGQVTIPKEIREELGLREGDEVRFEETEEGYVLRKDVDENPFEEWTGVLDTDKTLDEIMQELRPYR